MFGKKQRQPSEINLGRHFIEKIALGFDLGIDEIDRLREHVARSSDAALLADTLRKLETQRARLLEFRDRFSVESISNAASAIETIGDLISNIDSELGVLGDDGAAGCYLAADALETLVKND